LRIALGLMDVKTNNLFCEILLESIDLVERKKGNATLEEACKLRVKIESKYTETSMVYPDHDKFNKLRTDIQPLLLSGQGKDWRSAAVFNGSIGVFGCFIIKEDNQAFNVHTNANPEGWDAVTAGTVRFGPQWKTTDTTYKPFLENDNSKLCAGIVVGRDMMYGGLGSRIEFTEEIWDHKNQEEAAGRTVIGFRRADATDRDGFFGTAGDFAWHQGSALIGFYADPLT